MTYRGNACSTGRNVTKTLKKRLMTTVAIGLVIALVAASCGEEEEATPAPTSTTAAPEVIVTPPITEPPSTRTHVSETLGFRIDYPSVWRVDESIPDEVSFEREGEVALLVRLLEVVPGTPLENVLDQEVFEYQSGALSFQESSRRATTVNGQSAHESLFSVTLEGEEGDIDFKGRMLMVGGDDTVHMLLGLVVLEHVDNLWDSLVQSMDSFEVIPITEPTPTPTSISPTPTSVSPTPTTISPTPTSVSPTPTSTPPPVSPLLTAASRPFAINAEHGVQHLVGIFESEAGENLIGMYVINNDSVAHTNVQITMSPPGGSGIVMTLDTATVNNLPPGVPTLVTFAADFTSVLPNKYDMELTFQSDQSSVTEETARIFTATTTLNPGDPDFDGRPTFSVEVPEGLLTVDIETFYGGPDWRSQWAPTRETMVLEHAVPFEGQIGPFPYSDWLWKVIAAAGKLAVMVASGYYLGEAIAEGDVIKGAAAGGTAIMTVSEVTLSFDDADPFLRGQQNTFPGPGESTFKEMVTLDAVYLDEPMSGTGFRALTSWTYTRFTIDSNGVERTYAYSITDELVANLHWGGAHTLQTDAPIYGYGDIAVITATVEGKDGALLVGDEAYVTVIVHARPELADFVILTDDGQGADQIAGDGAYSGSMLIRPEWPLGDWTLILFAQENLFGFNEIGGLVLNSFPPGRPDFAFRHAILTVQ